MRLTISEGESGFLLAEQNFIKEFHVDPSLLNWQIQRLDYEFSILYGISKETYERGLSLHLTEVPLQYMSMLSNYQHIRSHGRTTHLLDYLLVYPELGLNYFWMPKNACTFIKSFFLQFYPERKSFINRELFHETTQQQFSLSLLDFLGDAKTSLDRCSFAVIRNPIERLISCYIDKFVSPIWIEKPFEEFIGNYIDHIFKLFDIKNRSLRDSITFREFCYFLLALEGWEFDSHWRPQVNFIPRAILKQVILVDFHKASHHVPLLVKAMNPEAEVPILSEKLPTNKTVGGRFDATAPVSGILADKLPKDLKMQETREHNAFLDKALLYAIGNLYKEDLELYEMTKAYDLTKVYRSAC